MSLQADPSLPASSSELAPTEPPLAHRVVRGGLVVALASYATIIIGFASTIVMARLVAPRDFGTLAIATFLFGILNLRTKIGIGQAFVHQSDTTPRTAGTLLTLDLGAGALSCLLALIAAPILRWFGYADEVIAVMLILAFIGLIEAGAGTPGVLLDKNLRFGQTTIVAALSLALSYLPTFYLAWHGWGVWSLVVQATLQTFLILLGVWWLVRRHLPALVRVRWTWDATLAKAYLRFGLVAGSAMIAGFLTTQFDNFLVGTFVGLTTLGFYDRAYRFASWPNLLISNVVARTSFFAYARLQDDRVRLSKTLEMTLWIITTLALPLALVIFVTAPDLIAFLIGEQWLPAATFLRFLVIFSLIRPLQDDIGGLLIALGKPHLVSISAWFQSGVLIVAATILTFAFGAVGTAIGVGIAFIVGCASFYFWVARMVDLDWGRALVLPITLAALTIGLYLVTVRWLDWNTLDLLVRLVLKTGFTLLVFYALTLVTQAKLFFARVQYVWQLARGSTSA